MMEMQNYWEESSARSMQVKYESLDGRSCKDEIYRMGLGGGYCEGNLNFTTASEDDEVYTKKKVSRQDPMSHRIIEKRRRDRMNNCLADLSRLIPAEYLKKGRGRVEKTEIIEMAIRHMKYLQSVRQDSTKHHAAPTVVSSVHAVHPAAAAAAAEDNSVDSVIHPSPASPQTSGGGGASAAEHYRLGYQECLSETIHFLVDVDGFFSGETVCVQLINHLQQHCEKILAASDRLGFPHPVDLPVSNGSPCSGIGAFSHANGGIPSMCPTGGNSTGNGINLLGNSNNHGNGHLSNGANSNHHHQQHPLLHSHHHNSSNHNHNNNNNHNSSASSNNSDRCSSSGVSSLDPSESRAQRPLASASTLVSDDSDHSNHSHASSSITMPSAASHHHPHHELDHNHHHHQLQQQQHQVQQQQHEQRPPPNYKFKNSIKQRFSADQRIKSSVSPPPASCNSGGSADSSPPRYGSGHHNHHHQGVPIFALHDNGGFYVPLTVEAATLRPYLGYPMPELTPETVLHPVTISVNFNHSTGQTTPWSPHSPSHQIH